MGDEKSNLQTALLRFIFHRSLRQAIATLVLLVLPGAFASAASLQPPLINLQNPQQIQADISAVIATACCPAAALDFTMPATSKPAQVSRQILFSSQGGSWPFEPFVNNGLFQLIAQHQPQHPRALVLSNGNIRLQDLHNMLKDESVLRPHKNGYLLSYPLMIMPGASLLVEDTALYLHSRAGAALIVQGGLRLRSALLSSWKGPGAALPVKGFRPFVIAWSGSRILIDDSQITELGYNAHLARGISLAHSRYQSIDLPPARIAIADSEFVDLQTALELDRADASVSNSRFMQPRQYALDSHDSTLVFSHNRIHQTGSDNGIRLRGNGNALIEHNHVSASAKAAVQLTDFHGSARISTNAISDSGGHGILLQNLNPPAAGTLLINDNLFSNGKRSAIYGSNPGTTHIIGNTFLSHQDYAIRLDNDANMPVSTLIVGNHIGAVGKAGIRVSRITRITLGDNVFNLVPVRKPVFAGDLQAVQSRLLETTLKQAGFVTVDTANMHGLAAYRGQ